MSQRQDQGSPTSPLTSGQNQQGMFVMFQFPLADIRLFQDNTPPILSRPAWPYPEVGKEFVRYFGETRGPAERSLSGWAGEPVVCGAERAIRFPHLERFASKTKYGRAVVSCLDRSFFHDGRALCKAEVRFKVSAHLHKNGEIPAEDEIRVVTQCSNNLISGMLNIPTMIPDPRGSNSLLPLFRLGPSIGNLFLASSFPTDQRNVAIEQYDSIHSCQPIAIIDFHRPSQGSKKNLITFRVPKSSWWRKVNGSRGVRIYYFSLSHGGSTIPVWGLSIPEICNERQRNILRKIKLYLLRLHSEQEVLRAIVSKMRSGQIKPIDSITKSVLETFLRDTSRHIRRYRTRSYGLVESTLAETARDAMERALPGKCDAVFQLLREVGINEHIANNVAEVEGLWDNGLPRNGENNLLKKYTDIFISYNHADGKFAKRLSDELSRQGLTVWLDEQQISPGQPFQAHIQKGLENSRSAAILIGPSGIGTWQDLEIKAIITRSVEAKIPLIPILLPGVRTLPNDLTFIREYIEVSFDHPGDLTAIGKIIWGVKGNRTNR